MRNARRLADQTTTLREPQDKLLQLNQMTLALNVVGVLIGIITAIVADRHHEHPARLGEGAAPRDRVRRGSAPREDTILLQFLCEAVMVVGLGGFVGVALGAGAGSSSTCSRRSRRGRSQGVSRLPGLDPAEPSRHLAGALRGVPAPIEALRYE